MTVLTLDKKGIAGAFAIGIVLLLLGKGIGWFLVAVMVYFLVLSYAVTLVRLDYKERRKLTERSRGLVNVAANGIAPVAFAVALFVGTLLSNNMLETVGIIGFLGAVSGITADKFASELGVLDGIPREILTMQPTKKGRSGGVTLLGLAMSAIAAGLVAVWVLPLGPVGVIGTGELVAIVTVSGFLGSVVDSVAGHFEEMGMGNKHTSNLICSVAAGIIAVCLALLL